MGNNGKKKKIIIGCTVLLLGVASAFTYSMVTKDSSSDTSKEIAQEDTVANENEETTNNADNVSSEEQANNNEQPSSEEEAPAEVKEEEPKEEEVPKEEQQAENTAPIEEKGPSNFNAVEGDESYNQEDDKNHDGIIDLYDLVLDSNK